MKIIRNIFLGLTIVGQYCAFGATVTSRYDEDTGRWIGDVDGLTNAFANAKAYETIVLSKGVYDLSPVTNSPLYSANGGGMEQLFWGCRGSKV